MERSQRCPLPGKNWRHWTGDCRWDVVLNSTWFVAIGADDVQFLRSRRARKVWRSSSAAEKEVMAR